MILNKALEKYSKFVSYHSFIVLAIVIVITLASMVGSSMVGTKYIENSDIIPDHLEVIKAYELLEDNFGSETTIMIAIELDPEYTGSDEIRDIRDPRVIKYINLLTMSAETLENVELAESASSLLKLFNNNVLPQTQREIIKLSDNPLLDRYISDDYNMAVIRMSLVDVENSDDNLDIVLEVQRIIDEIEQPPGLEVNVAGQLAVDPAITALVVPDIERIMSVSFMGIIILSFLVFFSIRYGIAPISVILIGIVWAMGFIGLMGLNLSAQTSGTISMIMGIGIDFGIQITNRFREEIKKRVSPEKAMEITMNSVFVPMATTTLAALIGFRAMSWGQLTFFGEFGDIMTYGVTACFLAAITIVPVILVQGEKIWSFFSKLGPVKKVNSLIKRRKEVTK